MRIPLLLLLTTLILCTHTESCSHTGLRVKDTIMVKGNFGNRTGRYQVLLVIDRENYGQEHPDLCGWKDYAYPVNVEIIQ